MATAAGDGGGGSGAPSLPAKHVTFSSRSPRVTVRMFPGEGVPTVVDGYANIETITRPLRRGLTRWVGSNPTQVSIPVLFDGWRRGESVEPDIADLERMAGLAGGVATEPLNITISSTGKLVPHEDDGEWFITGIDWGEALSSASGRRLRQAATITVTRIILAQSERSVAKRQQGNKHHARSYRVKKGDTLRSIARKVLGDPDRWVDIRRLNNISDPRIVGKAGRKPGAIGTILKMPK